VEPLYPIIAILFLLIFFGRFFGDLANGDWQGPAITGGLILFGYGMIQVKSNQPHGTEIAICGIAISVLTWISVALNSNK
jgi:hypothetical protein